jgi:hypothetical protein
VLVGIGEGIALPLKCGEYAAMFQMLQ